MTSIKSSSVRRTSLLPPHSFTDLPNATMVDRSSVRKSITQHPRQRDQETATVQEQKKQLDCQRRSLVTAVQMVENLHKRNSIDRSTHDIHKFYTNQQKKSDQIKK